MHPAATTGQVQARVSARIWSGDITHDGEQYVWDVKALPNATIIG